LANWRAFAMREVMLSMAVLLGVLSEANGASVEVKRGPKANVFVISGELEFGDEAKFIDQAIGTRQGGGVVLFASPGGSVAAGIEIGKAVRLKNFRTYVPANVQCASACALAWLGGRKRLMSAAGRVGFHAVYSTNGLAKPPSSFGNALVGAYLNGLALPEEAIFFITRSPPEEMNWLTFEEAARHGIEVERFELESDQPPQPIPGLQAQPRPDAIPNEDSQTGGIKPRPDMPAQPAPSPVPPAPVQRELADLLDVQKAAGVQERLRGLGYFDGVKDGVWGPRSRVALRDFKHRNRLPATDAWDLETQAALTGAEALSAPPSYIPPEPDFMSEGIFLPFAPLPGTAHHPLNPDDAELLQEQLRVAGYYQSSPDGIWGMNSRNALRQFKAANGLPTDDIWDVATERALMGRLGSEGRLRHVPRSR
jgi:peptidoglycan hydrolase-like protein with peptidoglycan-binding domain